MAFDKKIISYVTYSEDTEDFLRIGLVYYSEKSFAFSIEYLGSLTKDTLNKQQKTHMEEVKKFFGKTDDPEVESLNGMGNTKLDYGDGTKFFGYIYSIQSGQKPLDWFAERAALLPTRSQLEKNPGASGLDPKSDEFQEYLDTYSRKSKDELYEELGVPTERPASKYQKKPVYTTRAPTFQTIGKTSSRTTEKNKSASPQKEVAISGLPKSTKAKRPTLQEAFDVIFEAIEDGDIDEDFVYSREYVVSAYPSEDNKRIAYASMDKSKTVDKFSKEFNVSKTDISQKKGPALFILIKGRTDLE